MRYIRIPMERVAVLIGQNGEIRKKIEQVTRVPIQINSNLGEVTFDEQIIENPIDIFKIENIIRAIGRGFSPENALLLLGNDMDLLIFDIHDYVGKRPSHVKRLKSRVIGTEGKTKRVLEELTESKISIYGHTISIIGSIFNIDITKKAIDMILSGSKHATVYRFVETAMKKLRLEGTF